MGLLAALLGVASLGCGSAAKSPASREPLLESVGAGPNSKIENALAEQLSRGARAGRQARRATCRGSTRRGFDCTVAYRQAKGLSCKIDPRRTSEDSFTFACAQADVLVPVKPVRGDS